VSVDFDDYTCLVGANGAGKSTVLAALNVLFRQTSSPTPVSSLLEEDFHLRDTSRPITITATFADLSQDAQTDFKEYFRQGVLIVSAKAEWSSEAKTAVVRQLGVRSVMRAFAHWFKRSDEGARADELKDIYRALRDATPDLPTATSKPAMESALRAYEEAHPELCELLDSEHQFYGWTKGENRLRKYFQWVFIPAVKEAYEEQSEAKNTALGELLQRTIRLAVDFDGPLKALKSATELEYERIVASQQDALRDISRSLQEKLQRWAHPDARLSLEWQGDPEKAVSLSGPAAKAAIGEGAFVGEVSRLGHGLQRSFIISLLQELASDDAGGGPTLLLGFEEPELYQHPPQARHLATTLLELTTANAQVIVATHSPFFASGRHFESVRMFRKSGGGSAACSCTRLSFRSVTEAIAAALGEEPAEPSTLIAALEQILQPTQRELLFCGLPVLVEGEEDIALIAAHLRLSGRWDQFRRAGGHIIASLGKANLSRSLAIANELALPAYVLFDGDGPHLDDTPENRQKMQRNEKDNRCLLRLAGLPDADPLSMVVVQSDRVSMWPTDLTSTVREEIGANAWAQAVQAVRDAYQLHGVSKKNGILLAAVLEHLWQAGTKSTHLEQLVTKILSRAEPGAMVRDVPV
jgi:energy-coupling factor transporter ATP-binding protein EcfA2